MKFALSEFVSTAMKKNGWGRKEMARRLGYRNLNRGMNRLNNWLEGRKFPSGDQPRRLAEALGIKVDDVVALIRQDLEALREEARAERARDSNYYLIIRYIPGFYGRKTLPEGLGEQEAVWVASSMARELGRKCCLDTPSGTTYWYGKTGKLAFTDKDGARPYMTLKGRPFAVSVS